MPTIMKADRNLLAGLGIVLAVVLFLAINIFAGQVLDSARADLTDDSLYTVSDGTKLVLASISEPITIRMYKSSEIDNLGPYLVSHAERVEQLLDEYVRLSDGKLAVEFYAPQSFSPEEDLAVADGLRGMSLGAAGGQSYFGLAGTNSTDDLDTISFLAPERGNFLEYDLTRMISNLATPDKAIVAVMGDLPLRGTQQDGFRPWLLLDQLKQFFDVRFVPRSIEQIPDDVVVLMLTHPQKLDDKSKYAVDQFVMGGGRVLAFIDPFAETLTGRMGMAPGQDPKDTSIEDMEPLLASWGVHMEPGVFVADRQSARQVQGMDRGRPVVAPYLAWITMQQSNFATDDVITASAQRIVFNSAGAINLREDATTTITPLIVTSRDSANMALSKIRAMPNPVNLLAEFEPDDKTFILAARVSGPVKSAFADGPPDEVEDEEVRAAHKAEADAPLNLVLVGDGDMLTDAAWARRQRSLGQTFSIPVSSNADFVISALDNLSGTEGLMGLRSRGLTLRPFEVLQAMTREAEGLYRATEQELLAKIEETQARIASLQQQEPDGGGATLLTAEQQDAIEESRGQMIDLRHELREVQFALRQDVNRLETRIRALNIWAVPLVIGLVAIGLALIRRLRAARFQASIAH